MRFCARCGFPLEGAMVLLAHRGMLPRYEGADGETKLSPRRKGVKQGVAGPLRMLFAALFEEGSPRQFVMPSNYAPAAIPPAPVRVTALPQTSASPTTGWRARPKTAEIVQPPSVVTDHTTRLLEKSEPESD